MQAGSTTTSKVIKPRHDIIRVLIVDDHKVVREGLRRMLDLEAGIEVVGEGLKEIEAEIGAKIRVRGVGTTGSGRELIGKLIGADVIKDEITAHKTGATFVGGTLIDRTPDTIFEVGGQDSKYISIHAVKIFLCLAKK